MFGKKKNNTQEQQLKLIKCSNNSFKKTYKIIHSIQWFGGKAQKANLKMFLKKCLIEKC